MQIQQTISEAARVYREEKAAAHTTAKAKATQAYDAVYTKLHTELKQAALSKYNTVLSTLPKTKQKTQDAAWERFTSLVRKAKMTHAEFAMALRDTSPPHSWTPQQWEAAEFFADDLSS